MAMLNNQMVYVLYYILYMVGSDIGVPNPQPVYVLHYICIYIYMYFCPVYFHFRATVLR